MVEVNRMYAQGVDQINAQIERILRRYVKNGQISQAYALQLLSAGQTAQERERLLEQLQQTKEPQARRELITMLDAPAYADRTAVCRLYRTLSCGSRSPWACGRNGWRKRD